MSLSALEGGLLDLYEPDRITLLSFCRASNQFLALGSASPSGTILSHFSV